MAMAEVPLLQSLIAGLVTGIGSSVGVVTVWARGIQQSITKHDAQISGENGLIHRVTVTEAQCATCGESFARIESSISRVSDHIERQMEAQQAHRVAIEREIGRITGLLAGRAPDR